LVDLHLHTTASDGRLAPGELVASATDAGAAVIAVTDHDTVSACRDVASLARAKGIETITGIEITAVEQGRDVHMLGYFIDVDDEALSGFLVAQRAIRRARVGQIAQRLDALGMPVDMAPFTNTAGAANRTIGRPQVADAMIAAGYVRDRREAFDTWLGAGRPGFVGREGAPPEEVIALVHAVHGLVSLAHPRRTSLPDERIAALTASGLDAIEVYHSDHDATLVARYSALADSLGLLRTGGSDFHGDTASPVTIGCAALPDEQWARLREAGARALLRG
jgi:predicted metal-dependent phosphoesterase TrpH